MEKALTMVQAPLTGPTVTLFLDVRPDGRQSEAARNIARGTQRRLSVQGFACLPEVTLPNGRRVDLLALGPREKIWIIEIKSSLEDFRSDQKWTEYLEFCDAFAFAVGPEFPRDILPETAGLIIADRFGADVVRMPTQQALLAPRRKALITRMARIGALRLHALADPEGFASPNGASP